MTGAAVKAAGQRAHARWELRLPIAYRQVAGAPRGLRHGVTLDVSRGGVRFRAEEFLAPGVFVAVEMILPRRAAYAARGRVVWAREAHGEGCWEVGAAFLCSRGDSDAALAEALLLPA